MALFRKPLAQRLLGLSRINNPSSITTCRTSLPRKAVMLNHEPAPNKLAPDRGDDGVFRRYLHRRSAPAGLGLLPPGDTLLEKLRDLNISKDRIRLEGLIPPSVESPEATVTVEDAKKILRLTLMEKVKSRLSQIEKDCVSYPDFLEIITAECLDWDLGLEFAKILDESGSVIVLGNIVHLRPQKVVKAVEKHISTTPISPKDPRMKELQELEKQMAAIDKKASTLVKRELWCGLAYLLIQTGAFMRLTFWELTWDVMEPICFYVTSGYFLAGYAFFLRTSKEPSFEGFYQSRLKAKQKRLIEKMKFDVERYEELKNCCYPSSQRPFEGTFTLSNLSS
ncbi:calcium uniporter protein 2, mitochondrial-like [Andrographis paniculata]|uniref:calcium uniporter protein 2, mitochondrial-like n=1 Tax=Andrographis paniculata TaxID=175694 RepID=UPI0021E70900|nr:calcium uniporter protein 2, mitochondrial-like [Andrographis paniculata]